jgi:hypothetical protein
MASMKVYCDGIIVWNGVVLEIAGNRCNPPGEDPLRYFTSAPPPVVKMQQITLEVVKQQIAQLLLANQIQQNQSTSGTFSNSISELSDIKLESLKPEFDRDAGLLSAHSDKLFIIHPNAAEAQFRDEYRYVRAVFTSVVFHALESCVVQRRSHDGSVTTMYQSDDFEELCLKLSTALDIFMAGSAHDLNITWKEYLATTCFQMRQTREMKCLLGMMNLFINKRLERHLESEQSLAFRDQFLELARLRDVRDEKVRGFAATDAALEAGIRREFDDLLADLHVQIARRQSTFADIRRSVFEVVARRINAAMEVELDFNPAQTHDRVAVATRNNDLFSAMKAENAGLAENVAKLRVLRTMNQLAIIRSLWKRIAAAELDRKVSHSMLWQSRLSYESSEAAQEANLAATHMKLRETEIEIEQLKQQLGIEKTNNSQLVHWKAKNFKVVETLQRQIQALAGVGGVNIAELLEKLADRHAELDILREEGDKFDDLVNGEIRKFMDKVNSVKGKIQQTRTAKSGLLTIVIKHQSDTALDAPSVGPLRNENSQLKRLNRLLENEINDLETQKDRRGVEIRHFMEATVAPPPPAIRSTTKAPGIIIRPMPLKQLGK